MRSTLLILRYRLRAFGRGVRAHGFEIFFLGPVIVGGALWVADRQLGYLREPFVRSLASGSSAPSIPGAASLLFALLLVALFMPATFRELYAHRRAEGYFDALPIPPRLRFHASLAAELARALPVLAVLLLAAGALGGDLLPPPAQLASRALRLLAALLTLATSRFVTTLIEVHWRRAGDGPAGRLLAGGRWLAVAALLAAALAAPRPEWRLLLLPWLAPAAQLEIVFLESLGIPPAAGAPWAEPWVLAATAAALYLLARFLYLAWHRRDLEVAGRLTRARGRRWAQRLSGRLPWPAVSRQAVPRQAVPPALAVQIGRDVKLVLRRFSPAVVLVAGFALMIQGVVLTLLLTPELPALWRQRSAVAGLTLSVLAVVALVPFLLAHQLPRFWIEKSTGVDLEQIWKAKLWTAGLLALVPFATGAVILLATPGLGAVAKGAAVLQLAATAWIVASILGLAVFEIAAQPLLGLVFGSLVGLALAGLFVFYPQAWWLWAVLYGYVAGQIAGRATRRVRLVEVEA